AIPGWRPQSGHEFRASMSETLPRSCQASSKCSRSVSPSPALRCAFVTVQVVVRGVRWAHDEQQDGKSPEGWAMRLLNDLRNERIMTGDRRAIDAVVRIRGIDLSRTRLGLVVGSQEPVALLVHEDGVM